MKQSLAALAAMLVLAAAVLTAANTALDATAVPMPYTAVLSHGDAAAAEGPALPHRRAVRQLPAVGHGVRRGGQYVGVGGVLCHAGLQQRLHPV